MAAYRYGVGESRYRDKNLIINFGCSNACSAMKALFYRPRLTGLEVEGVDKHPRSVAPEYVS